MRTTTVVIAALALVACVSAGTAGALDDVSFDELEQMLNGTDGMDLDDKMSTNAPPTLAGTTNLDEAIFGRRRRRVASWDCQRHGIGC